MAETQIELPAENVPQFANPFQIEDLLVFDEATLRNMLVTGAYGLKRQDLAQSLHSAPQAVAQRFLRALPRQERGRFLVELHLPIAPEDEQNARQHLLDTLFWELTYWKTPELYEELTEGERLHPDIFRQFAADLCGKTVLDAGAGSGRATFEFLRQGAATVYAVEPSPGLLRILEKKLTGQPARQQVIPLRGRFDALPLTEDSVDTTLSASAFTAEPAQGGEPGLAEFLRVTRPGGKVVLIWPRPEDYPWLVERGFQCVSLPMPQEMCVRFRSLPSALRVARRFYARNPAVQRYLLRSHKPEVPFSILGTNPPHEYCWLRVEKEAGG
ncbi:MAG TPA: class I SAM-dependent methyltransferase [Ktedonobacterales bacterium]